MMSSAEILISDNLLNPLIAAKINEDINDNGGLMCVLSYGLVEAGYDVRIENICTTEARGRGQNVIDPKRPESQAVRPVQVYEDSQTGAKYIVAHPWTSYLGSTVEKFSLPRDVKGIAFGKSSYARCHVVPHVTPLEPGWCGHLTVEFVNLSNNPVRVYINEGFLQILFFRLNQEEQAYNGKYQNQGARPYLSFEKPAEEEF